MVAALLAFQVKFGVLQFRRQALGFLLQLLDVSLGLLVICLQVADLHKHTCKKSELEKKTFQLVEKPVGGNYYTEGRQT